jgi:hypothetical protein
MPRLIAASSSGVGGMSLRFLNITDLSAVCLTQADNVHALATLREHNAVQAILDHGVADLAREDEKHAVLADIAGVFGGIECNFHTTYRRCGKSPTQTLSASTQSTSLVQFT